MPRLPAHREFVTECLLPSFALSYPLLNNALVERFFLGKELGQAERRWEGLLKSYRKRAQQLSKKLIAINWGWFRAGSALGARSG